MRMKKLFLSFGLAVALSTTAVTGSMVTDNGFVVSVEASTTSYGAQVYKNALTLSNMSSTGEATNKTTQFAFSKEQVSGTDSTTKYASYTTMDKILNEDGTFNVNTFEKLDSKSQSKAVDIVCQAAQQANNEQDNNQYVYSDNDYRNWMTQIEQQDGIGSRLITTLMKNTKPDFATANQLYEPFSGVVGTALGVLAILLMAALALVMVLDLSYIAIPFVRNMLDGGSDGQGQGGGVKSKFVSWEAYNAVQQVEAGGGASGQQGGQNKTAIGIYFKQRVIMLLILGICLLYLVQGEIFTLVGYFMDLVSGFLGF